MYWLLYVKIMNICAKSFVRHYHKSTSALWTAPIQHGLILVPMLKLKICTTYSKINAVSHQALANGLAAKTTPPLCDLTWLLALKISRLLPIILSSTYTLNRNLSSGITLIILKNSFPTNKTIKEAALASFNVRAAFLYQSFTVSHNQYYTSFYLILSKCSFANCMSCTSSNVPIQLLF